jgi:hypothetical protein
MSFYGILACAACYGTSDSPLAKGMNWGIFSLLGVITFVLVSIASVGFVLARRAASNNRNPESTNSNSVSSLAQSAPTTSIP